MRAKKILLAAFVVMLAWPVIIGGRSQTRFAATPQSTAPLTTQLSAIPANISAPTLELPLTPTPSVVTIAETPTVSTTYIPIALKDHSLQAAPFGVALRAYTDSEGFQQALDLQARWLRRWYPLSWAQLEPIEGQYRWDLLAGFENELLDARVHNIEPIIQIQYTPSWAQKVPPHSCGPIRADKFEEFARFMEQLASRYGTATQYRVRFWQIANEPDIAPEEVSADNIFGCWGDTNDPYYGGGYYAEMLKTVYPRIKTVEPDAVVVLGGLLLECDPTTMTVPDTCATARRLQSGYFLEGVMLDGGGDYFDMVDVHSYAYFSATLPSRMHSFYAWSGPAGGTGLPEKVAFVHRVMAKYGYGSKPVFAGEVALRCQDLTPECLDVSAAFVPRVFSEGAGADLQGLTYFPLVDNSTYALLTPDLTPQPMYQAYKFMSGELANYRYERAVTEYPGVSGFQFNQDNVRGVQVLWSTDGTDQTIGVPDNFQQAFDKFGNPIVPGNNNPLTVGWSPIYVELK